MQTNYRNIVNASLLIATSGVLYGFLGYFGTVILQENITISTMLFWRFFIAGIWILLFVILKKCSLRDLFLCLDKRTLFIMFILGAIGYAGSSGFYFMASQYTGTGIAMVIFFSYPIIVAFTSWTMQRKSPSHMTILMLIAMLLGLYLLNDSSMQAKENEWNIYGIFFGLIAAGCYAFYVIGSKKITSFSNAIDSNILTIIVCLGCSVIFLMTAISDHNFVLPHTLKSWGYLLALGILATALPIQFMLEGLKHVSSMRASIISVLEPLVTVFVGVIMLNESLSHTQLLGAFIVLGSALLIQLQPEL